MKKFVVSKLKDTRAASAEDGIKFEISPHNEEPPKVRYATRIVFFGLLATGAILISFGVSLLVTCRSKVTKETCGIPLSTNPCSDLAVAAYFGCVLILATIFGFGCVGRKAMAVMLIPLVLGEMVYGIYILIINISPVDEAVYGDLSERRDICLGLQETESGNVTTTPSDSLKNIFQCWQQMTLNMDKCGPLWTILEGKCYSNMDSSASSFAISLDSLLKNCSSEVTEVVANIVWNKTLIIGPILIVIACVHLVSSVFLWVLRKSASWGRGMSAIPLPRLPNGLKMSKRFSVSKCHANIGTNDLDQSHQSLILHPNGSVVNMQKYVFQKIRRQKNTYATV